MMRFRRFFALFIAALLLAAALAGCSEPEPSGWPLTLGEVTFEASPRRVVSLSPALTEAVYALGYGGRMVGVSTYCDSPSAAAGLPRCGLAQAPDYEGIYALAPDLLLTSAPLSADAAAVFADMGVPVLTVPYAGSVEKALQNHTDLLTLFAGSVRGPEQAEQLRYYADTLSGYVFESVRSYLAENPLTAADDGEAAAAGGPPTAVYLGRLDLTLATGDTAEGLFLEQMGFANPAAPYTGWVYPPEGAAGLNPDVVFAGGQVSAEAVAASPVYADTAAVAGGRVFAGGGAAFERQSPHMFGALYRMAAGAFPEAFAGPVPDLMPPPPPEPEREPQWYDFITDFFA